jgi:hypothetical protein
MRGPHDIGGLPAGPVETEAHQVTFWEKQIDALRSLIGAKGLVSTDENRRYIEELGHDVYDRLGYYERWTAALSRQMVDRGILTQAEIDARVAELRWRLSAAGELELAPGEAEKR